MDGKAIAKRDFFISRAGENKDAALYVDRILREAGYSTFIQDRDFGSTAFPERMDEGFAMVEAGARIIAILSRVYEQKPHCLIEARYPLIDDPSNTRQRLIVLRIEDCQPTGFLKPIPYIDLVPLLTDEPAFRRAVLGAVDPVRYREEAQFASLHRYTGAQIIHPEVRSVPGFTGRAGELAAIERSLWGGAAPVAITDARGQPSPPSTQTTGGPEGVPAAEREAGLARASGATRNSTEATAALAGMGGVGKSVLAQQYAWAERGRYHGVWWVRAERPETLLDDLVALGARLIAGVAENPDRRAAALQVLDHIAQPPAGQKPWLLVYDNVEAPEAIEGLTPANGAHVLITTRHPDWHGQAAEVPVGVFAPETALAFLLERARGAEVRPDETRAEAAALAEDVGHLPLALAVARAHAWAMGWSYGTYRRHLAAGLEHDPRKLKGAVDYGRSVAETFRLALARAAEAVPEAADLMAIAAYLAPERIPLDIVTEDVMGALAKGAAVQALAEVSLAQRETLDDGSEGMSVHRLVQRVVRELVEGHPRTAAAGDGRNYKGTALRLVADAFPFDSSDVRTWAACRRLETHTTAVLTGAPETGPLAEKTAWLLNQYALHLIARADYAAAEPLCHQAHAIDEARLGPDHPEVAIRLNNLASLLKATNRLGEAEPLFLRALAIDEASLGSEHPNVARDLNNLASLLQDTNRLAEAEPLYARAISIWEASLGADDPQVAAGLNNLASLLRAANRLGEAEPLFRRVVSILEAVEKDSGHQDPNHGTCLNNLAELLRASNRLGEAEPLYRRALIIDEASYGPVHPRVARDLNNLALLLQATNRLGEAEPLFRRALAILEASLPHHHPWVVTGRNNLARVHAAMAAQGLPVEAPATPAPPPPPAKPA